MAITGKPLVQGDVGPAVRFTDLGLDWAGEGYTLKLKTLRPDGTTTTDNLTAVVGDVYAADLLDRTNLCEVAGYGHVEILVYDGATYQYSAGLYPVNIQESTAALVQLADVKLHLGITASTYDTQIQMWLDNAISAVANYCGTSFVQTTRIEYYQPDGYKIVLRNRPVISITSIYENANAAWGQATSPWTSDYLLTAGTDYALQTDAGEVSATYGYTSRSGIVVRLGKRWARRYSNTATPAWPGFNLSVPDMPAIGPVKITYVSGYTTIPSAVRQAVMWEVDAWRSRAGKGGQQMTAESLGEYSYSLAQQQPTSNASGLISEASIKLLAPFRTLGKGMVI